MIREITQAIEIWETRAIVTKVSYKLEVSSISFKIEWKTNIGTAGETNVTY